MAGGQAGRWGTRLGAWDGAGGTTWGWWYQMGTVWGRVGGVGGGQRGAGEVVWDMGAM